MENRKVMDMKQGSLETKMGRGEIRIGVLVQGYTEYNNTLSGTLVDLGNHLFPLAS